MNIKLDIVRTLRTFKINQRGGMLMIKVAICDDENMIASQIDNMILTICQKENISVDTDVFYGGSFLKYGYI